MSVVPGLPQRAARLRPQGAVIIPFPGPPTVRSVGSPRRPGPVRRPPRRSTGAAGGVPVPLRLTRRGRIVVYLVAVFLVAGLLTAIATLMVAYRT